MSAGEANAHRVSSEGFEPRELVALQTCDGVVEGPGIELGGTA
jgi:hypothetical protein